MGAGAACTQERVCIGTAGPASQSALRGAELGPPVPQRGGLTLMNAAAQGWRRGPNQYCPPPSLEKECRSVCVCWWGKRGAARQTDTDRWSHPHPGGRRGGCAPPVHHMWLPAAAHSVRDQLWWQLGRWGGSAMGPRGQGGGQGEDRRAWERRGQGAGEERRLRLFSGYNTRRERGDRNA